MLKILLIEKIMIIKINIYNIISENLNNIMFKVIFNNYKLYILYKTNVKRKKKRNNYAFKCLS